MNKALIGVAVVVILGGGGYLALHKSSKNTPADLSNSPSASSRSTSTNTTPTTNANPTIAATITFDGTSFSPATVTVKSGDTIAVTNSSSEELQFDSDPHPAHTDDTDLNVGTVDPGQTVTFTVTKKGNFGYHDHLDAGIIGRIVIE